MEADAGDEERRRGTGSRANNSSGCDDASGAAKSSGAAALNKIFRGLIVLFALALISAVCFLGLGGAQGHEAPRAANSPGAGGLKQFFRGIPRTLPRGPERGVGLHVLAARQGN